MPDVKTSDLRDWHIKEKPAAGKKKPLLQTRNLKNADINKARDQGKENGKEKDA